MASSTKPMIYQRKCQECGHEQRDLDPGILKGEAYIRYLDRKCKRCESMGLDYGYPVDTQPEKEG